MKLVVDDTNQCFPAWNENTINKATNTLSHLYAWFCANKLSLSINKTSYSIFGKHANDEQNTTIHLCNNDIQEVNCCKYLGVYVDNVPRENYSV